MATISLTPGRPTTNRVEISGIRELVREDIKHLDQPRPASRQLKAIRDWHHRIARAIGAGLTNTEIAIMYSMSPGRVSNLRNDPAVRELAASYQSDNDVEYFRAMDPIIDYLGSIRTKSLAMIEDKIEDARERNEFLPSRDLATFAELGLDRTGYGKINKNININADYAAELEGARSRIDRARDITPITNRQADPVRSLPERVDSVAVAPCPPSTSTPSSSSSGFRRL